jgi:hypothetical protein
MPQFHDKPVKPATRLSRTAKERLSNAEVERFLKAHRRYEVARTAAAAGPRPSAMVRAVAEIAGEIGWLPTRPTICALAAMYLDAPPEFRDEKSYYLVEGHGGRHKQKPCDAMQQFLEADLRETPALEADALLLRLELAAERMKLSLPGEFVLRRIIDETRGGVLGHAAGAHGRRGADADALPHETLPYTLPFDCATMDEVVLPLWVGVWHDLLDRWVSWLLYMILILDYASRVLLGYHLCDPRPRLKNQVIPERGLSVVAGFTEEDVMAAWLSVAHRELAPDFLADYCDNVLPRHIRLDSHSTHVAWKETVRPYITTRVHLVGDYRPFRNGVQERMGATSKRTFRAMFAHLPGNVDSYIPTDRIKQNQRDARVQAIPTGERVRRKIEIAPEDLPRVDRVRDLILPQVFRYYNREHEHSAHGGRTPHNVFMSLLPRRNELLRGDGLIRALPSQTLIMTGAGFQVERNKKVHRFDHRIDNRIILPGSAIVAHLHPLLRCVWAVEGPDRKLAYIPEQRIASGQRTPEYVHRMRAAITGDLSEQAQANMEAAHREKVGEPATGSAREASESGKAGDPGPTPSPTPTGSEKSASLMEMVADGSAAPLSPLETWFGTTGATPASARAKSKVVDGTPTTPESSAPKGHVSGGSEPQASNTHAETTPPGVHVVPAGTPVVGIAASHFWTAGPARVAASSPLEEKTNVQTNPAEAPLSDVA